jgi:DNA-directed RNA polymerase subunit beta'
MYQLRHNANTETSKQRKTEALKDYKLLNPSVSLTWTVKIVLMDDYESGTCYSTRITSIVPLDGGRFATSDLNDLYRRNYT